MIGSRQSSCGLVHSASRLGIAAEALDVRVAVSGKLFEGGMQGVHDPNVARRPTSLQPSMRP